MKKIQKIVAIVVALSVICGALFATLMVSAAITYSPNLALDFAADNYRDPPSGTSMASWMQAHPLYDSTSSNWWCAEFVSRCLYYGGITAAKPSGYITGCHDLRQALLAAGAVEIPLTLTNGAALVSQNPQVAKGDVVFWKCVNCYNSKDSDEDQYQHAGIINIESGNNSLKYYARHNSAYGTLYTWTCVCGNGDNPPCADCCYGTTTLTPIVLHLPAIPPTGRVSVDFSKDGAWWANPTAVASGMYVKNRATNQTYSLTPNPDYNYAYRTSTDLPYGTYDGYANDGSGNFACIGSVELNAACVWIRPHYYTVSYNANGGSGTPPASAVRLKGRPLTLPGAGGLSKTNHTFTGWTAGGNTYQAGATYTVNAATTFTAAWTLSASPVTVDVKRDGYSWSNCSYGIELRNTATGAVVPLTRNDDGDFVSAGAVPHGSYEIYAGFGSGTGKQKTNLTLNLNANNTTATLNYYTVEYWCGRASNNSRLETKIYAQGHYFDVRLGDDLVHPNYTFCYWHDGGDVYIPNRDYSVTEKLTLVARWILGEYALGDVNMNGRVDSTDARMVNEHFVGSIELEGTPLVLADYNMDGNVDTTDGRLILQAYVAHGMQNAANNGNELMSMGGKPILLSELDWDSLDLNAIDWDNCTVEYLLQLLGVQLDNSDHEVM